MQRLFVILALCAGCARQPRGPFLNDAQYLRFGVDPRSEADALVKTYAPSEPLALRIVAHNFTALGFMDRAGRPTRARVVTSRGIALALDPQVGTPLQAAVRYALLSPPLPDTNDADRDGFEEVFIEKRSPKRSCLLVYRVRDVGYVDLLPISVRAFSEEHCVTGVEDSDGDGRAELFVDVMLVDFELPVAPAVRLLLWPDQHRFTPKGTGDQLAQYVAAQQAGREIELEQARKTSDVTTVLRLAVELAALNNVLGLPVQDQVARFDRALRALPLSGAEQAWADAARRYISQTWNEAPQLVEPEAEPSDSEPQPAGLAARHAN